MVLNENFIHNIILSEVNQNVRFNPTKAHVYNTFNTINATLSNGKLPMCNIEMISNKKYLGYFEYDELVGNRLINPTISINSHYQYTIKEFESVVGHEMIHYYLAYYGIDVDCGHGDKFKMLANKLNSALGLNITETVDVSQMTYGNQQQRISTQLMALMKSYADSLKGYLPKLKQESKGTNGKLTEFYSTIYIFTDKIADAMYRCVKKGSLNEGAILNGIQQVYPFKPINSFINGFKEYYGKADRWLGGTKGEYGKYGNLKDGNLENANDLISLLYSVYPNIKKQYQKYSMGYNSQTITNEFTILDDLRTKIDAEVNNAQGSNP